jgi:hypothetical protein
LDTRNIFNAVSRERLREIIVEKFPTLEPFADLIYDGAGETFVRKEHGSWVIINVNEGFSQGCPASPVFVAIVLHNILSTIQPELKGRAAHRKLNNDNGDDGYGSIGFFLAHTLLHHEDVEYFLQCFEDLATSLGAILNKEKTRIMATTTGTSLLACMKQGASMRQLMTTLALERAIGTYSTNKNDAGTSIPHEATDGLRVLGAPIGLAEFCNNLIKKAIARTQSNAVKLITNLDDLQTMLHLYSVCTVHRITHLFGHAVYNTPLQEFPTNYWLWDSLMTTKFGNMTADLIAHVTNLTTPFPVKRVASEFKIPTLTPSTPT